MTWTQIFNKYEQSLKKEMSLSQNSVTAYLSDIKRLIEFMLDRYNGVPVKKVRLRHLEEFLESLVKQDKSASTQARMISSLRSFFKFLLLEDIINGDPTSLIQAPKHSRKIPDYIDS